MHDYLLRIPQSADEFRRLQDWCAERGLQAPARSQPAYRSEFAQYVADVAGGRALPGPVRASFILRLDAHSADIDELIEWAPLPLEPLEQRSTP